MTTDNLLFAKQANPTIRQEVSGKVILPHIVFPGLTVPCLEVT